jgi:hypothetical protein
MSITTGASLSPQETLARQIIVQRVAQHHHAPRGTRRHIRAALLLRSLAERLDPSNDSAERTSAHGVVHRPAPAGAGPHAGSPRPWSAAPRRSAHRQS